MNDWRIVKFSDLYAESSRNGVYKSKEHQGSGVKIVNMGELFAHNIIKDQEMKRLSMSESEMIKSGLANGDLLFGRRSLVESGAGKCSLVENLSEPTTFESSIIRVRLNQNLARPRFYFYWLLSHEGNAAIRAIVSGTNVKGIRSSDLQNIKVCQPPLNVQDKVVDILRNYDDLIENNRRRIQLLERSLHLLYKEWFVHLRFPSHEHSKIVDGIPEGWENKKITELSVVIDGTHDSPKPTDNGYYMVTGRHIINGFIDFSKCYFISEEDHRQVMQRSKPEKGDIIFSNIGTLGSTVWVDQDFEFSIKNLALFKPHKKIYSNYLYGFFSDPRRIEDLNNQSSGTSQKFFSLKFLRSLSILTPPLPILEYFDDLAQPILKQRSLLHYENIKLQKARDLLLPKLMSGAIGV